VEAVKSWVEQIRKILDVTIVKSGETEMTLWTFLYLLIFLFLLLYLSGKMKTWLAEQVLS